MSFTSKILNNATSALNATQALIATTGNNIANVNTPGYVRRTVQLETRSSSTNSVSVNVGSGVDVSSVTRAADKFLESVLQTATSGKESAVAQNEFIDRINQMFALTGSEGNIGDRLGAFFRSLDDLSANASSIELRRNVIQTAGDLTVTIANSFNSLAKLQREADDRVASEVNAVNSLTSKIAELNSLVTQREADGVTEALDERDARDVLVKQLAEKISFTALEDSNGSLTISLSNGFPLVNGATSRALSVTNNPSFAAAVPEALDGQPLSYVVFDYDSGPGQSEIDLTTVLKNGEGSIGGLLKVRGTNASLNDPFAADGPIVEVASRIESITRALLTEFNEAYLGADYDPAAGHQPSSGDLDGNTPGVFGLFTYTNVNVPQDSDGDGLPTITDLNAELTARGGGNFSTIISIVSDPRRIAAALATTSAPAAPAFAPGDGRNAAALANLQFDSGVSFSAGNYSFTGTFGGVYQDLVSTVGNRAASARVSASVAEDNFISASNRRDEVSGVSLDEEFTNLIKHQKAFEASARMIRVADEILEQIVTLI